jgi:hypothetical protein
MFGNQFAMFPPKLFMGTARFMIDQGIFGKDLHSYDDRDHKDRTCKWLANKLKKSEG